MWCQDGGRFVQDQDIGLAVKGFDDFDALLDTHRQILHHRIRIDLQAVLVSDLQDALFGSPAVEEQTFDRLVAEHDILGYGQDGHELEVLMHHADAECDRVVRVVDVNWFAIDQDLAFIRRVEAVDQVHECALASAVFAQQT